MIRCVRMWTGEDGNSAFEEGTVAVREGEHGDFIGKAAKARKISFRETASGGSFEWHQDPEPRYVITLSGTLEFETRSGATFTIRPGDILIAQDNSGSGHKWRLIGDDPWRRAYVVYEEGVDLGFVAATTTPRQSGSHIMPDQNFDAPDIVLIGAGIMGATVCTVLKELQPSLSVMMFETLDDCGQESSEAWNNAGTGHAANCELNYTPQRPDGSVDISKALEVNTEFDISRQLWAYLVRKGAIPDPRAFIHPIPHMSFVWGSANVAFLRERFRQMSAHHCYYGTEYSEDRTKIAAWAPLIMEGRADDEPLAATRIITGTDVDYGALTHLLLAQLAAQDGFAVHYNHQVVGLEREANGRWRVTTENTADRTRQSVSAKFVFIGAGGASIDLLQMALSR